MTDQELEAHIHDCGRLMLEAMAAGNREEAEFWLLAQKRAIAARSPEQIARMELERGLSGSSCYFDTKGQIDREALSFFLRGQAA